MALDPARRELAANLFREEAGKMTAALARVLGLHNLELAEDLVQETLCHALEIWRLGPLPENPAAWLMRAARNRAIDTIRRERTRRRFAADVAALLSTEWTLAQTVDSALLGGELADEQLRMMFSCCAPGLSEGVSAALILKLLCGFSVGEIAAAFLASHDAIEKQLVRGKAVLKTAGVLADVSGAAAVTERLPAVERALYLLFNEGYHGAHPELTIRRELCAEAIRLASLLASHPAGDRPRVHALVALLCLHGARLPARADGAGELVLLEDQDRARWDQALVARGLEHLERSAAGDELTELHLEAAIAARHAQARSIEDTDWRAIRELYDLLARLNPSPVVALNRAIVVAQLDGPEAGLAAIAAIPDRQRLDGYLFYPLALAELERRAGRPAAAARRLERARTLARNPAEERLVARKRRALDAALGCDGA
jgi:RNA polymerase sigma-70 factor (ECF subfamily)